MVIVDWFLFIICISIIICLLGSLFGSILAVLDAHYWWEVYYYFFNFFIKNKILSIIYSTIHIILYLVLDSAFSLLNLDFSYFIGLRILKK
jgi:hypothetical protein